MLSSGEVAYRGLLGKYRVASVGLGEGDALGPTVVLTLDAKGRETIKTRRISFSTRHAYLVTRSETDFTDSDKPDRSKVRSAVREVLDVWELGPGLVLPKTVRTTRADEPEIINLFEVRDVVCNEPIAESEFSLPIPEGTIVVDHRVNKFHLWGKGAPARTFASNEEFSDWRTRQDLSLAPSRTSAVRLGMAAVALACIGLIIGLVAYRRRVARSAA